MKKWLMISALIIFAVGTVACGGKDKRTPVRNNGRDRQARPTDPNFGNNYTTTQLGQGQITTNQDMIDTLLSVAGNPSEIIGNIHVSGAGVFFSGSAVASGSGLSRAVTSSQITLTIKDDWTIQGTHSPYQIPDFVFYRGSVNATQGQDEVNIEYESPDFGQRLVLNGTVPHTANSNFTGNIYFENYTVGVNTNGLATLGTFSIPTCSFFECKD